MRTAAVLFPTSCSVSYGLCLKKSLAGEWEVEGQGQEGDKPLNSLEFGWFQARKMLSPPAGCEDSTGLDNLSHS